MPYAPALHFYDAQIEELADALDFLARKTDYFIIREPRRRNALEAAATVVETAAAGVRDRRRRSQPPAPRRAAR